MKRLRLSRWPGQLRLGGRPSRPFPPPACCTQPWQQARLQSSAAASPEVAPTYEDYQTETTTPHFPSPLPERALSSAKLAALHARLSLPEKIPLQTLARALVDPSADADSRFNNSNLSFLGSTLLSYYTIEWLVCHYPRLPFHVLTAAARAFAGPEALAQVSRSWGVETVAEPGDEVDPGLLQFSVTRERPMVRRWGYERPAAEYIETRGWRRGINMGAVTDDEFGDMISHPRNAAGEEGGEDGSAPAWRNKKDTAIQAHADLVRAVVGATYAHCGRPSAHAFIRAHVLSRHLNLSTLFSFHMPTRELVRLCAREGFDPPVARLLSETGRLSRSPVIVVGIFSGNDKLGEGSGPNPHEARAVAAMNALKSWYLYSPGPQTRVPSDMLIEGAKPWEPAYVDIGEII